MNSRAVEVMSCSYRYFTVERRCVSAGAPSVTGWYDSSAPGAIASESSTCSDEPPNSPTAARASASAAKWASHTSWPPPWPCSPREPSSSALPCCHSHERLQSDRQHRAVC